MSEATNEELDARMRKELRPKTASDAAEKLAAAGLCPADLDLTMSELRQLCSDDDSDCCWHCWEAWFDHGSTRFDDEWKASQVASGGRVKP